MEKENRMKRLALILVSMVSLAATSAAAAWAADPPADRVLALYFHRTQRCPTCLKMGSYSEEAVTKGFETQVKEGTVEFRYVDFQNQKNANLTKAYKITGPALIVAKVANNKVKEHKNLKDIWTKVREKPEFIQYVRENVEAYLRK
jgi:opacity protein-like surface antigen